MMKLERSQAECAPDLNRGRQADYYRGTVKHRYFRGDAFFGNSEIYELPEPGGMGTRSGCRQSCRYPPKRPVCRSPHEVPDH
jgi:hypothetical protein